MREKDKTIEDFLVAVKSLFDYYNLKQSLPSVAEDYKHTVVDRYDPRTTRFIDIFLMENNLIRYVGADSISVINILPPQIQLLNLCREFFKRHQDYIFLPSFSNLLSLSYQYPTEIKSADYQRHLRSEDIPIPLGAGREDEPISSKILQFSGVFSSTRSDPTDSSPYTPRPKKKLFRGPHIKMNNWSVEDFIQSVRLLYDFYDVHKPTDYKAQILFSCANLARFTAGTSRGACIKILERFNKFLNTYDFISQRDNFLKTIKITKELSSDAELVELFECFKKIPCYKHNGSTSLMAGRVSKLPDTECVSNYFSYLPRSEEKQDPIFEQYYFGLEEEKEEESGEKSLFFTPKVI